MSIAEDRLRILRMIQEGQIDAEEGARRLAALEEPAAKPAVAQLICVRVIDTASGHQKVNVNIPANLLGVGIRLGAQFGRGDAGPINIEELLERIRAGASGKLLELENSDDGERVEIHVE